jgi:thioesterase domain-containing protein
VVAIAESTGRTTHATRRLSLRRRRHHRVPSLAAFIADDVEVFGVQLPRRETRFPETPLRSVADIARPVADAIRELGDLPVVLFGHSMSAVRSFDIAERLQQSGRGPGRAGRVRALRCNCRAGSRTFLI